MTINNIKNVCENHFAEKVGKNVCCDVLAGEQGPSCKSVNQIPKSKLIHVHFIPCTIGVVGDDEADIEITSSLPPAPSVVWKRKMESASTSIFQEAFRTLSNQQLQMVVLANAIQKVCLCQT